MIKRTIKLSVIERLKHFPAVLLLGPRQVGKTTFAKTLSDQYYDLETDEDRLRLDLQWDQIIQKKELIILNEAQYYPEIFPKLKATIDSNRSWYGRFIILGSVSPSLIKEVSDFLTGRVSICYLFPFGIRELKSKKPDDLWLLGGYPDGGILNRAHYPTWGLDYLSLLSMKDLPAWGLPAKPQMMQRFFKMLSILHGSIWNASQIGKSLGLNYHTINSYIEYLEQAFLIRRVQPYFINIKKRIQKSPKIYWRDSGLLHGLNKVHDFNDLLAQPWVGTSWEGWIIEQIIIHMNNLDYQYDGPYYLRTRDGYELDLILIVQGDIWVFEIKLSSSPGSQDLYRLNKIGDLIHARKRILLSRAQKTVQNKEMISTNILDLLNVIDDIMG